LRRVRPTENALRDLCEVTLMLVRARPTVPHLKQVPFDILVLDVGGTNIKVRATGQKKLVKIPSGRSMSPREMMGAVRRKIAGWNIQAFYMTPETWVKAGWDSTSVKRSGCRSK